MGTQGIGSALALAALALAGCSSGEGAPHGSNGGSAGRQMVPPVGASGGLAVEGPGDVKSDPMLQTNVTPPSLGAGSPARGADNAAVAPPTDYWGNPRGASVDLGCVQSP